MRISEVVINGRLYYSLTRTLAHRIQHCRVLQKMKFLATFFLLPCFWNAKSEIIIVNSPSIDQNCNFESAMFQLKREILNALRDKYCPALLNNTVRPTTTSRCYGYCAGLEWDDLADTCDRIIGIRAIEIYYDHRQVNSIRVAYLLAGGSVVSAARHGHSVGSKFVIRLGKNESIKVVEGSSRDNFIGHLTFTSENERGNKTVHGPYGQPGQERFAVNGYIMGLKGFSDNSVNGIGVYYLPPLIRSNHTLGGTCSDTFHDDKVDSIIPPVVGISMIKLHSAVLLDAIQVTYLLLDGSLYRGNFIGGTGGSQTLIKLCRDEELYRIAVSPRGNIVGQVTFYSKINETLNPPHGPYGIFNMSTTQLSGNIVGFYGYSRYDKPHNNDLVCRIGVYTVNQLG